MNVKAILAKVRADEPLVPISVRVSTRAHAQLQQIADIEGRSIAGVARAIIETGADEVLDNLLHE